jgi:hypothetical protein
MMEVNMNRDKKAIKREILDKFRSIGVENDTLPPQWLESDYFDSLDKVEKKIFKQAIKELVSSGLVEQIKQVKGTDTNLRLTQKGLDLIY